MLIKIKSFMTEDVIYGGPRWAFALIFFALWLALLFTGYQALCRVERAYELAARV